MPLTRKGANAPLKATRSQGIKIQIAAPVSKSKNGRKNSTEKKVGNLQKSAEKETAKNILDGKKVTKTSEDAVTSHATKGIKAVEAEENTTEETNRNEEKTEMEISEDPVQTSKKRKLSADVSQDKEEPVKRTKMAVKVATDVVATGTSPRRSSRAVVPNSRYKDMEVLDIGKKKSSIGTSPVTNTKKMVLTQDKVEDTVSQPHIPVETGIKSNISDDTMTSDTVIDGDVQMNLMDDFLVLPPRNPTAQLANNGSKQTMSEETHVESSVGEDIGSGTAEILEADNTGPGKAQLIRKEVATLDKVSGVDIGGKRSSKTIIVREIRTSGQRIEIPPLADNLLAKDQSFKGEINAMASSGGDVVVDKVDAKQGVETIVVSPQIISVPRAVRVVNKTGVQALGNKQRVLQKTITRKPVSIVIHTPSQERSIAKQAVPQSDNINSYTETLVPSLNMVNIEGVKETSTVHTVNVIKPVTAQTSNNITNVEVKQKVSIDIIKEVDSLNSGNSEPPVEDDDEDDEDIHEESSDDMKSLPTTTDLDTNNSNITAEESMICEDSQIIDSSAVMLEDCKTQASTSETENTEHDSDRLPDVETETIPTDTNAQVTARDKESETDPVKLNDKSCGGNTQMIIIDTPATVGDGESSETEPVKLNDKVCDGNTEHITIETTAGDGITIETTAGDGESSETEPFKPNDKVCDIIRVEDKDKGSSPRVAIEYVVFGDRIVPIHKPFSQTNAAAVYKKRSNTLKRIPAKVAQTAISSLLEGIEKYNKPPNTAFTIEEPMEEEEEKTTNTDGGVKDTGLPPLPVMMTDKTQEKPGRVLQPGSVSVPEGGGGPTEIVEISENLFAKEVYGEDAVLDPVTGQMVSESMLTARKVESMLTADKDDASEANTADDTPGEEGVTDNTSEVVNASTEASDTANSDGDKLKNSVLDTSDIMTSQPSETPDKPASDTPASSYSMDNMPEGNSVILQIKSNGVVVREKLATYKAIKDVKITPAVSLVSTKGSGKPGDEGSDGSVSGRSGVQIKQIKPVRGLSGTDGQREIETQTEDMEDELEGGEGETETSQKKVGNAIVVVNHDDADDKIRRTTVMMEEDGQLQEYVVVHLPEGAEIKQQEVKQFVKDPIHSEVVTMSEDGMYICVDCNHKTDKKGNWYKHRRKHLGIRPHSCPKCDYKAATSSNLKRHMQIHDDVRNYECPTCGLYFRQKIHLERHIKYKHQEKKIKCPLCDYLCSSENPDLKIHIRRRHMPQEDGSMSAFTCSECGLMTVSKKDLKQHMKFHKKGPELKLFCEFCSFVTDCESRLRRHMLIHSKEKPFQCGLCSYRASQKEHVLRHMKTQHDVEVERKPRRSLLGNTPKQKQRRSLLDPPGQPEYNATDSTDDDTSIDDKLEVTTSNEKLFEKSDYSSTDKIFACNHCSMKFSKLINLYKHLFAQHKQVMPETSSNFQCVVCDFRTNNKKNLLVHMRKHNMHDHSPPTHVYSCVLCRYINPRRRNLFQHMKKKHGIEIMMKEDGYNCYISGDVVVGNTEGESGIMALSEIITKHPLIDDAQLQIIAEDGSSFQAEKMSLDNIMSIEDINTYDSTSPADVATQITTISNPLYQSSIAEHEAAEAIEGLQALAETAAGVVETQTIDSDITTEIITSDIMDDTEIITAEEDTTLVEESVTDDDIQISPDQINQLSAGDYVEINGEVYKVEITQENAP